MLSKGQAQYLKQGILVNVRSDGRLNSELRQTTAIPNYLLYVNGSCKYEAETTIYTGVKLELAANPTIQISISAMKKTDQDKAKALYLQELLQLLFKVDLPKFSKKGWQLNVEVFLLSQIDEAYTQSIAESISAALTDLKIPKLKVTKNFLTEEEEYEIIANEYESVSFIVPKIHVIGQVGNELVKDLTAEEFYAVEKKYIISISNKTLMRTFDKVEEAFSAEDFLRVLQFVNM